jgi:hypothetical protein
MDGCKEGANCTFIEEATNNQVYFRFPRCKDELHAPFSPVCSACVQRLSATHVAKVCERPTRDYNEKPKHDYLIINQVRDMLQSGTTQLNNLKLTSLSNGRALAAGVR